MPLLEIYKTVVCEEGGFFFFFDQVLKRKKVRLFKEKSKVQKSGKFFFSRAGFSFRSGR